MPWMVIYPLAGEGISYEPDASKYKDGNWIVTNLVDIVAKGGNFMVGIGPDATGLFHPQAIAALQYAGAWLKTNGEAISILIRCRETAGKMATMSALPMAIWGRLSMPVSFSGRATSWCCTRSNFRGAPLSSCWEPLNYCPGARRPEASSSSSRPAGSRQPTGPANYPVSLDSIANELKALLNHKVQG